jgi:hypothetical protein
MNPRLFWGLSLGLYAQSFRILFLLKFFIKAQHKTAQEMIKAATGSTRSRLLLWAAKHLSPKPMEGCFDILIFTAM